MYFGWASSARISNLLLKQSIIAMLNSFVGSMMVSGSNRTRFLKNHKNETVTMNEILLFITML